MRSARNRELIALVPVALLLTAGFAAVFAQEGSRLGNLSLIYGAVIVAGLYFRRCRTLAREGRPAPFWRRFSRNFFQYSKRLTISRSKPRSTGW